MGAFSKQRRQERSRRGNSLRDGGLFERHIGPREISCAVLVVGSCADCRRRVSLEAPTMEAGMQSEQVYWVFTVTFDQIDKFTPLIPKLLAATEKEPGALQFECLRSRAW